MLKIWLKKFCYFQPLDTYFMHMPKSYWKEKINILYSKLKSSILLPLRHPRLCFIVSLISTLVEETYSVDIKLATHKRSILMND